MSLCRATLYDLPSKSLSVHTCSGRKCRGAPVSERMLLCGCQDLRRLCPEELEPKKKDSLGLGVYIHASVGVPRFKLGTSRTRTTFVKYRIIALPYPFLLLPIDHTFPC